MRLIDADALKTVLQRDQRYNVKSFDKRYDNVGFSYDQVMFTIDKQPTIDAEPVIRCKNCKYSKRYEIGGYYRHECIRTTGSMSVDEDDYCSRAVRKEDKS